MHLSWFFTMLLFTGYASDNNEKEKPENTLQTVDPYISTVIYFDPTELEAPEVKALINDQNVKNVVVNSIIKKRASF